jgi:hypothetical protein
MLVRPDGSVFSKAQILDDLKEHPPDGRENKAEFRLARSITNRVTVSSWFTFKVVRIRFR